MIDQEAIRIRIKELEKKVKETNKKEKKLVNAYKQNPEWIANCARMKVIGHQRDKLETKIDKKEQLINDRFFKKGDWNPYYGKATYSGRTDTNIHWQVLEAIKKNLRITLLRGSDIETLTSNLAYEAQEKTKIPQWKKESKTLYAEQRALEDRCREIEYIPYELNGLNLNNELRKLKDMLKHPEKHKRWDKRDQERAKSHRPETIKAIFKTFKELEGAEI